MWPDDDGDGLREARHMQSGGLQKRRGVDMGR